MYDEFNAILQFYKSNGYDWNKLDPPDKIKLRESGKCFSRDEFAEALIWSLLSAQRPWCQIETHLNELKQVFHNFDWEYLKSADPIELENGVKALSCGNRQIKRQMQTLRQNLLMLEKAEKDFVSLDAFVTSDKPLVVANRLAYGDYKLQCVGVPLAMEFLKGVGVDTVKPDVHIVRILQRWGYVPIVGDVDSYVVSVVKDIAKETGLYQMQVDSILWQFCATGYYEICVASPRCPKCPVNSECSWCKRTLLAAMRCEI